MIVHVEAGKRLCELAVSQDGEIRSGKVLLYQARRFSIDPWTYSFRLSIRHKQRLKKPVRTLWKIKVPEESRVWPMKINEWPNPNINLMLESCRNRDANKKTAQKAKGKIKDWLNSWRHCWSWECCEYMNITILCLCLICI